MNVKIENSVNVSKTVSKIAGNNIGLKLANEWRRLIQPFVPRRNDLLMNTVEVTPWYVRYKQAYARKMYKGKNLRFRHDKNPRATHHWDRAAKAAGQHDKLLRAWSKLIK